MIDTQNGRVTPRIYTDPDIYNWSLNVFSAVAGYFSPTKASPKTW